MNQEKCAMLVLAIIAVVMVAAVPAGAQPGSDFVGNETTTKPAEPVEKTDQLGDLVIHNYRMDDDEMVVRATWEGRAPTTVTLVEMQGFDSEGSVTISFQKVRLVPDETTKIRFPIKQPEGRVSVMLSTPESIERGDALVLTVGENKDLLPTDPDQEMLYVAAGGTSVSFLLAFLLLAFRAKTGDSSSGEQIA